MSFVNPVEATAEEIRRDGALLEARKQDRIRKAQREEKTMATVLLPWTQEISWKCQSILQGGFRGPDDRGSPAIKAVNRWLRTVSQYNADPSKDYMKSAAMPSDYDLCKELEYCTCHYTHHMADALRVVAIWHPVPPVRKLAWQYHFRIAEELFHFLPEGDEIFIERHKDKVDQGAAMRHEARKTLF